jgi:hypothetical protein
MKITYTESLQLWHLLSQCPKKLRENYGKRKKVSETERKNITRIRNRLHAQHTRLRRKIFSEVLKLRSDNNNKSTPMSISSNEMQGVSFTSSSTDNLQMMTSIDDDFFDNFDY